MTPKGERTRQRLVDVAMARFATDGFSATTIRAIAADAGISVGLTYRYFASKEHIVLAYYEQVAQALGEQPIEGETLGTRFASVMRHKFALVEPHRRALGALLGAMLDPDSTVGVLSEATLPVRQATEAVIRQAIEGARDRPHSSVEALVQLGVLGHTLLLLAWVQRPKSAEALLDRLAMGLDAAAPYLAVPLVAGILDTAADAVGAFAGPSGES